MLDGTSILASPGFCCGSKDETEPNAGDRIGAGLLAKIGAGCGPDCMNSALTRIAIAAAPAMAPAIESRERGNIHRSTTGNARSTNGKRKVRRPAKPSSFTRAVPARMAPTRFS